MSHTDDHRTDMANEATKPLLGSDQHYALRPGVAITNPSPYASPTSSPLEMTPRPLSNSPLSDTPDRLSPTQMAPLVPTGRESAGSAGLAQVLLATVDKRKHEWCPLPAARVDTVFL